MERKFFLFFNKVPKEQYKLYNISLWDTYENAV
jgi:hypothetical protein